MSKTPQTAATINLADFPRPPSLKKEDIGVVIPVGFCQFFLESVPNTVILKTNFPKKILQFGV